MQKITQTDPSEVGLGLLFGSSKKLCDLAKNAGIRDTEFIKILQVLPNSCEVCIRYKKTEPRPIHIRIIF